MFDLQSSAMQTQ